MRIFDIVYNYFAIYKNIIVYFEINSPPCCKSDIHTDRNKKKKMLELSEFIIGKTIIFGIFLQNKTVCVLASKNKPEKPFQTMISQKIADSS